MDPNYLSMDEEEFNSRVEEIWNIQESCDLCGHKCEVNRLKNEYGICKSGVKTKISSHYLHYGEENCLVGKNGSGTIFISNCCMNCIYCQNSEISQEGLGNYKEIEEIAEIMIELQEKGAHNINWVSPTHFTPQLVKALKKAKNKGLKIPIVYNTGGYDSLKIIKKLRGLIDIYMPDMKYGSNEKALKYSNANNYWTVNKEAVKEMHKQVGNLKIEDGIAQKGLLVRHLVLPNNLAESEKILKFLANEISLETYINIMKQYHPSYKANNYKELNRRITNTEYREIIEKAREFGFYRGF